MRITFGSLLNTFEERSVFWGSCGSSKKMAFSFFVYIGSSVQNNAKSANCVHKEKYQIFTMLNQTWREKNTSENKLPSTNTFNYHILSYLIGVMRLKSGLVSSKLDSKALLTHNIFACNIVIKRYCDKKIFWQKEISTKRYCDKKIFFNQYFFSKCELKIFFFCLFEMILKCNYNILKKKISFYRNIFSSFYRNIVRQNVSCE